MTQNGTPPSLSIIIVNWNTRDLVHDCLSSLFSKPCDLQFEVYVVDNASRDGSAKAIARRFPQVRLIANSENVGFSRANNQAIEVSSAPNVLLLNSDTVVDPDVLPETVQLLRGDPSIGALGCKLVGTDGEQQTSYRFDFPSGPDVGGPNQILEHGLVQCAHVWGAYLLVKREVIDQVGMLDENFFMFYEDIDWCWRMHDAGWKIVFDPSHSITHVCRASCNKVKALEHEKRLAASWVLLRRKHDPSFNWRAWRVKRMIHHGWCRNWYKLLHQTRVSARAGDKWQEHRRQYKAIADVGRPQQPRRESEQDGIHRSALADRYLTGLQGIEIGGSAHNAFGLDTLNVDYTDDMTTIFKSNEMKHAGYAMPIDVVAQGDALPFVDNSQDFVISSHVLEHFYDPIATLAEWNRVVKDGGYIFAIIPHRDRTFDKDRPRTTLAELIQRHNDPDPPDTHAHHSVWITEDFVELAGYLGYEVVETQDEDDKVGNGFAVLIRVRKSSQ